MYLLSRLIDFLAEVLKFHNYKAVQDTLEEQNLHVVYTYIHITNALKFVISVIAIIFMELLHKQKVTFPKLFNRNIHNYNVVYYQV